jgi:Putative threonine efflux protein
MSAPLITYTVGCLALIAKPGPDLMCTLATALSEGRRRAIMLMTGLIAGCWLWVVLLTVGAATFFTGHPKVLTAIRVVGMAYIGYLALGALHEAWVGFRGNGDHAKLNGASETGFALFRRGIIMSMSNPLTILFFLAFLPHFIVAESTIPPSIQILLLGTFFCALVPVIYLPVIFAADEFRVWLAKETRFPAILKLISGLILLSVVAWLAFS